MSKKTFEPNVIAPAVIELGVSELSVSGPAVKEPVVSEMAVSEPAANELVPSMPEVKAEAATPVKARKSATVSRKNDIGHLARTVTVTDSELTGGKKTAGTKTTSTKAARSKSAGTKRGRKQPRQMLALLISAHNEELVLENTLRSAIAAGMKKADIFVVDDNSADATSDIARKVIGPNNVVRVKRSGKGLALTKASKHFKLTKRYRWIHIADADGGFAPDYFPIFRGSLRSEYAAATGYISSLPGSAIGDFRVFEYTIGMEIHRRFQAFAHTVSVIPGPTSCFRWDVFEKVDFANKSLTEDFDVTLQIHRKKLGKIQFIRDAVAYTQDPKNIKDYRRQIRRWNRGIMQGVNRHKIGRRFTRIDAYLSYQIVQNLLFFFNYCVLMPFVAWQRHNVDVVAEVFLFDVLLTFVLAFLVAAKARRWDVLSAFPYVYALRWVQLFVFLRAFIEVGIFRRFKVSDGTWAVMGRRYKQNISAN
jgi:cellulose synthase/poly-beta-1,6-N-acetylglucosamine synthase-like glycosyltransferase